VYISNSPAPKKVCINTSPAPGRCF